MDELSDNIIGIDFLHKYRLHYDHQTWQIKFLTTPSKVLCAIKKTVIPALSNPVINDQYFGGFNANINYIANICAPRTPMILGMPSIISFNVNNHCQLMLQNCAPYEITI